MSFAAPVDSKSAISVAPSPVITTSAVPVSTSIVPSAIAAAPLAHAWVVDMLAPSAPKNRRATTVGLSGCTRYRSVE